MEKEFVPYELAVKLKELGFDEECFGAYHNENNLDLWTGEYDYSYAVKAPLWQQAFDWFRERYGFICEPKKYVDWWFDIEIIVNGKAETECIDNTINFETYQEARQACLEKLIELITNK